MEEIAQAGLQARLQRRPVAAQQGAQIGVEPGKCQPLTQAACLGPFRLIRWHVLPQSLFPEFDLPARARCQQLVFMQVAGVQGRIAGPTLHRKAAGTATTVPHLWLDKFMSGDRVETGTAARLHSCWEDRILPISPSYPMCMVNSLPEG